MGLMRRIGALAAVLGGVFAAVALAAPVDTGAPSISGKAVYGQALRCNPGTWTGAARFTYGWQISGGPAGAGQTFKVPLRALGYSITCTATAYDASGGTASATSPPVTPQPATPTVHITKASAKHGTISISGTISPKAAVSGPGASVVLLRALGHNSYEQLTFGGLLHHRAKFSLKAKDTVRGRHTYVVEFNPYSQGFVAQVLIYKKLDVR